MNNTGLTDKEGTPINHDDIVEVIFKTSKIKSVPMTSRIVIRDGRTYQLMTRRGGGETAIPFDQEMASFVKVVGIYDPEANEIIKGHDRFPADK